MSARQSWPQGTGELADRIRRYDWSRSPLGPIGAWPERLKAAIDAALASSFPTYVWWGKGLIQFYNDACLPILRERHPVALGQAARVSWSDAWPQVGAMIERVLATGQPVRHDDLPVTLDRDRKLQQAYFTFCYSALRDLDGSVAGLSIVAIETTSRVDLEQMLRDTEQPYRNMLNSVSAHVAVVDHAGHIIAVNRAWSDFARSHLPGGESAASVGTDYLDDCRKAGARGDAAALSVLAGIQDVLAGRRQSFMHEYPCHGPDEQRWFQMTAVPLARGGAALAHADITERMQAESALRDSELRFSRIFQQSATAMGITNRNGGCVDCNPAFRELVGYSETELHAMNLAELVHPDDRAANLAEMKRLRAGEVDRIEIENRYRRKDGTSVWVRKVVSALPGQDGPRSLFVTLASNIDARHKAETSMRDSLAQFHGLLDNSSTLIWLKDEAGRFVFINGCMEQRLGLKLENVRGRTGFELFPREFAESVRSHDQAALAANKAVDIEEQFFNADGSMGWWHTQLRVVNDNEGRRYIGGIAVDITARKAAEQALRISEEQYRSLVEDQTEMICRWQGDGVLTFVNRAYAQSFGRTPEELIGRSFYEFIPAEEREEARAQLARLSPEHPTNINVHHAVYADGETRWTEWVNRLLLLGERGGPLYQATGRDITERKRREATQAALAQAQRMEVIGQLAGGVAHDINNLLSIVAGNLELALQRVSDSDARHSITDGLDAIQVGSNLNRRLLSFARQRALEPIRLNVNQRIAEISDLLKLVVGDDIAIVSYMDRLLWDVQIDPGEIENALINLMMNARDAMADGGDITIMTRNVRLDQAACASLQESRPGEFVLISISDSGHGMSAEVLQRAFDPFFTTKPVGKGSGLGLSTVYGFVRQSGGFLSVSSSPGAGTQVSIYLPRAEESLASEAAPAPAAATAPAKGELILLVEDNRLLRNVTRRQLESLGYQVVEAATGKEALTVLQSNHDCKLVFSDVLMPGGMSGYDLADHVRRLPNAPPILLATGHNDIVSHTSANGASIEVLHKPYGREELARRLRRLLDR